MKDSPRKQLLAAYETHADDLFRHCYLRTLQRDQSKALLEETFRCTWDYLQENPEVRDVRLLLFRVMNTLIADFRSLHRDETLKVRQKETDHEANKGDLFFALRVLSEQERDVMVMHYIDRLNLSQIATVLQVDADVISKRLDNGVRQLHSLPVF